MEIVTVNGNRNCDRINETHNFVTCEGCGLVYLNPRNTVEDYDYYYQNFDNPGFDKKSLNKIDLLNADYAKELEFIAENIIKRLGFPSKDIKILDCGCGNGLLLYMFKKLGYTNITGLEPAVELVKYAHDVLDINLSQGTVSNNNLETNSFDLVISTSMLDHFHLVSPIDELKAMRSFLRYGGHIFGLVPELCG